MTASGPDRRWWASGAALIALLAGCSEASDPQPAAEQTSEPQFGYTGALDFDCSHSGRNANGVEVFLAPCPRGAVSPDGKWRLVNGGEAPDDATNGGGAPADGDRVFVETAAGGLVGPVPGLSDGMPFAMFWSPRPGWFFVEHHAGSFMQVPEVFEITPSGVVRHDRFLLEGQEAARERFPCLPDLDRPWANGNIMGWTSDGRRLAWVLRTRIDVCMEPGQEGSVRDDQSVRPVLMVSDIDSGRVIEGSVVVLDEERAEDFVFPDSAPYRNIVTPD